jgi:ATP-dependent Clp protease, protease subunit
MTNGVSGQQQQLPQQVYAAFVGSVDQQAMQRIVQGFTTAIRSGVEHIHLLFQSSGGTVGDGIALYNFFRALPIKLSLYNVGTVASIGAVAYLGAKIRKASAHATFMVHRTQATFQAATAERLHAHAYSVALHDQRTEAILRRHLEMPDDRWKVHEIADLWMSANEALEYNMATAIEEFSPPPSAQIFHV